MKKQLLALLCCMLLVGLSSCAGQGTGESTPPEGAYQIYYAAADTAQGGAAIGYEYRTLPENVPLIPALMNLLLAGPTNSGLQSPFPAGVKLLSWNLDKGQLQLDLSEQYSGLSGVNLTIADYCIVLTMCQVEGVESVSITVEGELLAFRHSQQLRPDDVMLSGAEEETVRVGVNLWFPRTDGYGLGVEYRQVIRTEDDTLRGAVLAAWLEGPEYESLAAGVPEDTEILSVELEEGICYADLSADFLVGASADPGQAKLLLYALVNTMGGLDSVDGVQLLVEGEQVPSYGGVDTSRPLKPDISLEKN